MLTRARPGSARAKVLEIDISPGTTTANTVVAAINASGVFTARLDDKRYDGNDGSGAVDFSTTATTSGGTGIVFNQADGIQVVNGGTTHTITFEDASTVEDLLPHRGRFLLLDRLVHKNISIQPTTKGKLPEEFELDSIVLEPDKLTLSGPQIVLGNISKVSTKPIDLSDAVGSAIKQVTLDLQPEIADLIGESVVTARVNIRDKMVDKRITKIPLEINGLVENLQVKIKPSHVSVVSSLPLIVLKNNEKLRQFFQASLDLSGLPDGRHEVAVDAKAIEDNFEVIEVAPDSVFVTIKTKEEVNEEKK